MSKNMHQQLTEHFGGLENELVRTGLYDSVCGSWQTAPGISS